LARLRREIKAARPAHVANPGRPCYNADSQRTHAAGDGTMRIRDDYRTLTGQEKASILLLSLGEEVAAKLFALMSDDEIKELSQTMAGLGNVNSSIDLTEFLNQAE
jgi:hypothetical protein